MGTCDNGLAGITAEKTKRGRWVEAQVGGIVVDGIVRVVKSASQGSNTSCVTSGKLLGLSECLQDGHLPCTHRTRSALSGSQEWHTCCVVLRRLPRGGKAPVEATNLIQARAVSKLRQPFGIFPQVQASHQDKQREA